jgi:hypothetical protein
MQLLAKRLQIVALSGVTCAPILHSLKMHMLNMVVNFNCRRLGRTAKGKQNNPTISFSILNCEVQLKSLSLDVSPAPSRVVDSGFQRVSKSSISETLAS